MKKKKITEDYEVGEKDLSPSDIADKILRRVQNPNPKYSPMSDPGYREKKKEDNLKSSKKSLAKTRAKRLKEGRCTRCGGTPDKGMRTCSKCRRKEIDNTLKWRDKQKMVKRYSDD